MITINGLNHYQELSQRTAKTHDYELANYGLGIAGEAGEVASLILKTKNDTGNYNVFKKNVKKELGDVLWYTSQIARLGGLTLEELKIKSVVELELGLVNNGLGLSSKAGEIADLIKKAVFHGHQIEIDIFKSLLSDVLSHIIIIGESVGLDIIKIAAANIEKLKKRYPSGFSRKRSINRVEE